MHVEIKRPSTGLAPSFRETLFGRTARASISRGSPLDFDLLQ
jgi:sialic acid synthase SpsE